MNEYKYLVWRLRYSWHYCIYQHYYHHLWLRWRQGWELASTWAKEDADQYLPKEAVEDDFYYIST